MKFDNIIKFCVLISITLFLFSCGESPNPQHCMDPVPEKKINFESIDNNKDNRISFQEFAAIHQPKTFSAKRVVIINVGYLFDILDMNKNKFIERNELSHTGGFYYLNYINNGNCPDRL